MGVPPWRVRAPSVKHPCMSKQALVGREDELAGDRVAAGGGERSRRRAAPPRRAGDRQVRAARRRARARARARDAGPECGRRAVRGAPAVRGAAPAAAAAPGPRRRAPVPAARRAARRVRPVPTRRRPTSSGIALAVLELLAQRGCGDAARAHSPTTRTGSTARAATCSRSSPGASSRSRSSCSPRCRDGRRESPGRGGTAGAAARAARRRRRRERARRGARPISRRPCASGCSPRRPATRSRWSSCRSPRGGRRAVAFRSPLPLTERLEHAFAAGRRPAGADPHVLLIAALDDGGVPCRGPRRGRIVAGARLAPTTSCRPSRRGSSTSTSAAYASATRSSARRSIRRRPSPSGTRPTRRSRSARGRARPRVWHRAAAAASGRTRTSPRALEAAASRASGAARSRRGRRARARRRAERGPGRAAGGSCDAAELGVRARRREVVRACWSRPSRSSSTPPSARG